MLSKPSHFDNDLDLQIQKYLSYVETIYKKDDSHIRKKDSVAYSQERDDLLKAGTRMRDKINTFKKTKSATPILSSVQVQEMPHILISDSSIEQIDQTKVKPNELHISIPENSVIDLPSSPMRNRAVSSFGLEIEDPELESHSASPEETRKEIQLPEIPKDFESTSWSNNAELSIIVLQNGVDIVQQLVNKSSCSRIYAETTPQQQKSLIFSKFLHHQLIDKNQCISFSDALLNYCKQFKDLLPLDWLKNKNKSQNLYASMNPIHQEIIQIIKQHVNVLVSRFPSQSSRISKAFAKVLVNKDNELEFVKQFLATE